MLCILVDEAAHLSETLVAMYQAVQHHIPDVILTLEQLGWCLNCSAWFMKNVSIF
jgi:hypothetical protein